MNRNTSIAFFAFSLIFIAITFSPEPRAFWMFKIFPIVLLGIEVTRNTNFTKSSILILALVASGVGDLLLHFDLFIPGLSAFLVAQIFYAWLFLSNRASFTNRLSISIFLIVYLLGVLIILYPKLGEMQIPVFAYMLVISIMGFAAIQSKYAVKWAVAGALIFILSDSLIAINKFIIDIPFERVLIMTTYYAAQWMLVKGFLESPINSDELELGK